MSDVVRIFVALLAWLASFSAIYGLHGIGCAFGWPAVDLGALSAHRIVLVAAWLATIALQIVILTALRSERWGSSSAFVRRVSQALGWVALLATAWSLFPVAATSSCLS